MVAQRERLNVIRAAFAALVLPHCFCGRASVCLILSLSRIYDGTHCVRNTVGRARMEDVGDNRC